MSTERILTLSSVYYLSNDYLSTHPELTETQQTHLRQIQNAITAIEVAQKGWLKSGGGYISFARRNLELEKKSGSLDKQSELGTKQSELGPKQSEEHSKRHDKDVAELTQELLLEEAEKAYKDSLNFTYIIMNHLLYDINYGRYARTARDLPDLFGDIRTHLNCVISALEDNIPQGVKKYNTTTPPKLEITDDEKYNLFAFKENPCIRLAIQLGGRYLPVKQIFDPLRGENEGLCFGYTRDWINEVAEQGYYQSTPRADIKTYTYQINQQKIKKEDKLVIESSYKNGMDVSLALDSLLQKIEDHVIYSFRTVPQSHEPGHAMGLRRIHHSGEIEFFDANFGIFVFPDVHKFRTWFLLLLRNEYCQKPGKLALSEARLQPQNAVATIPDIKKPDIPMDDRDFECPSVKDFNKVQAMLDKCYFKIFSLSDVFTTIKDKPDDDKMFNVIKNSIVENFIEYFKTTQYYIPQQKVTDETMDDNTYHEELKEDIIKALNREVQRLEHAYIGDYISKRNVLVDLRERITNAPKCATLNSLINQWLNSIDHNNKTNRKIISDNRIKLFRAPTRSFKAIANLLTAHEINPACYLVLQEKLICKIVAYLERELNKAPGRRWVSYNNVLMPKTFADIFASINKHVNGQINLEQLLEEIQLRCNQNNTGKLARAWHWRSIETDKLYEILSTLNVKDFNSLQTTYQLIDDFENKPPVPRPR